MKRRFFLRLPAYAAAGGIIATDPWSAEHLMGLIDDRAAARALGQSYLQARPDHELTTTLLRKLPSVQGLGDIAHLRRWVQQQIRDDFAHGNTLVLAGWQLSHTEAAICSLFVR